MRSNGWTVRNSNRVLELSLGGRWFLASTLAIGIAAVYSNNNVIYLLESLLLSSLLLSGVLSEITVSRVIVRREENPIYAGRKGEDVFIVENPGRLPLYCVELGEFTETGRELSAFLLVLPGRSKVRIHSHQIIAARGRHRWQGLLVATSFPFGFASKIRLIEDPGSRIVWPVPIEDRTSRPQDWKSQKGELEVMVGEVTPMEPWQDASRIHWPISLRVGELMVRPTQLIEPREEIWLNLRHPGPEMEHKISLATDALSRKADVLVIVHKGEKQKIQGTQRALNALALLPKEAV